MTTCDAETEQRHEGGDANRVEAERPKTAVGGGDGAVVYKKGAWSKEEDEKLRRAVDEYGVRNWVTIEKFSGLARPAKNCRLRWLNYLRPNLKKYPFTEEEEKLILHLHSKYGNSWSRIASKVYIQNSCIYLSICLCIMFSSMHAIHESMFHGFVHDLIIRLDLLWYFIALIQTMHIMDHYIFTYNEI